MKEDILVGRERERDKLKTVVDEVKKGRGRTVIISGERGVGKSALIEWLCKVASDREITCIKGSGVSRDGEPYHPLNDAFKDLRPSLNKNYSLPLGISILSKKFEQNDIIHFHEKDPNALRQALEELCKMASKKPMLMIIEELHLADKSSVLAFRYIAENIEEQPIMLVATCLPEKTADYHSLKETLYHLRQKDLCDHMRLGPLEIDETREILKNILGRKPTSNFCEFIHSKTEGNPLFITETVKSMLSKNSINPENDFYPVSDDTLEWPSTVRYVVERKMVKLDKNTKDLLQRASVLGDVFDYTLLSEVTEMDNMKILDMLDIALDRGILVEEKGGEGYSFKHSVFRDILYRSQFKYNKVSYHKKAAEAIERLYADSLESYRPQLAVHYERARLYDRAFENYIKASESAEGELEKIKYYRSALELSTKTSVPVEIKSIRKLLGIQLMKYGSKHDDSLGTASLEEAKKIFQDINEEKLLERCRKLLDRR
ncbi:MAG: BREX system ATP-binding domain-containing protein [Thermoplasmata archaeon]